MLDSFVKMKSKRNQVIPKGMSVTIPLIKFRLKPDFVIFFPLPSMTYAGWYRLGCSKTKRHVPAALGWEKEAPDERNIDVFDALSLANLNGRLR
jgi:hypothetical protein